SSPALALRELSFSTTEELEPQGTRGCTEDPRTLGSSSLTLCSRVWPETWPLHESQFLPRRSMLRRTTGARRGSRCSGPHWYFHSASGQACAPGGRRRGGGSRSWRSSLRRSFSFRG